MTKPTLKELWAWWKKCEEHLKNCNDVNCELYHTFNNFKSDNDFYNEIAIIDS